MLQVDEKREEIDNVLKPIVAEHEGMKTIITKLKELMESGGLPEIPDEWNNTNQPSSQPPASKPANQPTSQPTSKPISQAARELTNELAAELLSGIFDQVDDPDPDADKAEADDPES